MTKMPIDAARPPAVVVYTHSLLAPSMTFIKSHAEALSRHSAVYAGSHRVAGLAIPEDRVVAVNDGGAGGTLKELAFRQFGIAPGFFRRLRAFSPALAHVHFGDCGPAGLQISRELGIPFIVTFHGRDATISDEELSRSWRGRHYLKCRAELARKADRIIAVSRFIKARVVEQGFDDRRVEVLYNGIDSKAFAPSGRPRERSLLFIGRLVEKKGCIQLLEALARLKSAGQRVPAVLVGDGPLRSSLEARAAKDGLDVEFAGLQSVDEVRRRMDRAQIVVIPSVTAADGDSEGLPTVLLEAQAMQAAVIATRHSGIPEGVVENESALLVPERDSEALAGAILALLDDAPRCERMGRFGRSFVEKTFSMEARISALEDCYQRVCADAAGASAARAATSRVATR
jgi:glycosyltransferase involved in cell wall biosynthesis